MQCQSCLYIITTKIFSDFAKRHSREQRPRPAEKQWYKTANILPNITRKRPRVQWWIYWVDLRLVTAQTQWKNKLIETLSQMCWLQLKFETASSILAEENSIRLKPWHLQSIWFLKFRWLRMHAHAYIHILFLSELYSHLITPQWVYPIILTHFMFV